MMRSYLAYFPEEEPRIFRMLDLISRGAEGCGPVQLLLTSAAEIGFAWEGEERGWVRAALPAVLEAWHLRVTAQLAERKGFRGVEFADVKGSLTTFLFPPEGRRYRGVWNGFLWDEDGHLFGECTLPHPPCSRAPRVYVSHGYGS